MKCQFLESQYNVCANNWGRGGKYNLNMKWTESDFTDNKQNDYEMVSG